AETPEGANEGRVAVMTNGLGSVSYEELFVIHGAIDALLRDAGITPVEPDVGEMCTSFDMAGVSLTLCWLDAELEKAWLGPANTPAYRKGSVAQAALRQGAGSQAGAAQSQTAAASAESQAGAKVVAKALQAIAARIDSTVDYLGQLDQIAGDGDHGIGMQRGATGAAQAAAALAGQPVGVGAMLIQAGNAWAEEAGGTSGALWGLLLRTLGGSLGDSQVPDAAGVAKAVEQASQAVMTVGKAQLGDKTMVDALVPFVESLKASQATGLGLVAAWQLAAEAATKAAEATADLVPKIGRARPHAEKSVGTPDPGAVSLASIAQAVGQALGEVD
ncbi:MAG: DAK2 domain-containing protein, partial [Micrococcales bacterium]|nr:DAK2 domain-containing protein [Micrococcales bacterium]